MRDAICVHGLTWLVVALIFSIFALVHYLLCITLSQLVPFFIATAAILLSGIFMVNWRRQAEITTFVREPPLEEQERRCSTGSAPSLKGLAQSASLGLGQAIANFQRVPDSRSVHERHETQMMALRGLQIIIFLISYVFASIVADVHDWRTQFDTTLLHSSLCAILFLSLVSILPSQVPMFLAMMALPPMVDAVNLDFFYAVIEEQMKTLPAPPRGDATLLARPLPAVRQSVSSSHSAASGLPDRPPERLPEDPAQELSRHRQMIRGLARRVDAMERHIAKEHGVARCRDESDLTMDCLESACAVLPSVSPEIVGNPGLQELHVPREDARLCTAWDTV